MDLAFLIPLVLGFGLWMVRKFSEREYAGAFRVAVNLLNTGAATLVVACIFAGILEIAGSDSPYQPIFLLVGCLFGGAGMTALVYALGQRSA
jgi:uncharacterized membrane protein YedE/YeeE